MRIAYVTDQILPQTATDTRQMVSMAAALGHAGAEVTLVTPARWTSEAATAEEVAAYYEVPLQFDLVTVRSVYPNIRGIEKLAQGIVGPRHPTAGRADLVYTRTLPILLGALTARRPVVYETYRPWPDQQPLSRPLFRWIGRQPHFVGAVLHSHLAASSYARAGVPQEKLLPAHNGYDPSALQPALSKAEARPRCGLPGERPVVVYTGRVAMKKGLGLVLTMAEAMPEALFVLVGSEGDGPVEQRAATLANVRMVPWLSTGQTIPYLYAADVLLIPPTSGPLQQVGNTVLPIKTFLYMAAGRAILAPRTPDVRELLRDDENAALVPPDDLEAALRQLRRLLDDPLLRERLGKAAQHDVAGLTWGRRAERVLRFLRERLASSKQVHRMPNPHHR
ncbi:MAG: glycosyltransferase, partial [Rhodothermales bacterium]